MESEVGLGRDHRVELLAYLLQYSKKEPDYKIMISEEEIKKMDSLADFFSKCFYAQFGIYPKVWYDTSAKRDVLNIDIIKDIVNKALHKATENIFPEGIGTRSRKRPLAIYRQYYFYLCMTHTNATLARVGKEIGNYDHATVLHGVNCIKEIIEIKDKLGLSVIKNIDLEFAKYNRENQIVMTG